MTVPTVCALQQAERTCGDWTDLGCHFEKYWNRARTVLRKAWDRIEFLFTCVGGICQQHCIVCFTSDSSLLPVPFTHSVEQAQA